MSNTSDTATNTGTGEPVHLLRNVTQPPSSESAACPTCGRKIDPYAADTIEGVELRRVDVTGGVEWVDGPDVLFHEDCFPYASQRYRLA